MIFHHYQDIHQRGTIEKLHYKTVNAEGEVISKKANVYLPYGYTEEKKYDILYLIHGGGGNEDAWLDTCAIKNMLDVSFAEGRAEPFIAVFPTYYNEDPQAAHSRGLPFTWEKEQIEFFQKELRQDLIPAAELKYSSYLSEDTEEDKANTRNHRAITGFSMGGGTTWNAFLMNMQYFSCFLPLSGDCWIVEIKGGASATEETVRRMMETVKNNGFGKEDFRVYAGTGTEDIAYPALNAMIQEMKKHKELFEYSEDNRTGNLHYEVTEGAPHTYADVYQHLYNFLPYIFK